MFRKQPALMHKALFDAPAPTPAFIRPPARAAQSAVARLSALASGTIDPPDYSELTGDVRYLSATDGGLFNRPFQGDPGNATDAIAYAQLYLRQKDTILALGLKGVELVDGVAKQFAFGTRVEYQQKMKLSDHPVALTVRGGYVHVFVDKTGEIKQVTSTIRRGRKPSRLGKIISPDAAITRARLAHDVDCETKSCELVLSSHETPVKGRSKRSLAPSENLRLDPVYEVTLQSGSPKSIKQYLVDARTGTVVHSVERLLFSRKSPSPAAAKEPDCRYFPLEPNAKVALSKQVIAYTVADLPDPTKLENKRFKMLVKNKGNWEVLRAKADGTFNYDIDTPQFEAVIIFVCLNKAVALQEKWGMTPFENPLPVYVHDEDVPDNAYADPINMEVHIGVGSGGKSGLRKFIGYDKMVEIHEVCGHIMITIMTPGRDLRGKQGASMHEDTGDFFAVLFTYTDHVEFAVRLQKPFGVADVQKDGRVVGPYSIDGGIRVQRNTKKTPADDSDEPHAACLIPGGADCDELEALIVKAMDINVGAEKSGRIKIAAMALVPAHTVKYTDMLRAMLSADETLNKGVNRQEIIKAFADHGIKLTGSKGKKKQPGKGSGSGKGRKSPGKSKSKTRNRCPKIVL